MTAGTGVALIVIGAILAFAVHLQNAWVDFHLIGYILMVAGAVVFVLGLVLLARRRQSISTTRVANDPVTGERVRQQQISEPDDSPLL